MFTLYWIAFRAGTKSCPGWCEQQLPEAGNECRSYTSLLRWCGTRRLATTIFSTTQHCNSDIVSNGYSIALLCCAENRRCESSRATSPLGTWRSDDLTATKTWKNNTGKTTILHVYHTLLYISLPFYSGHVGGQYNKHFFVEFTWKGRFVPRGEKCLFLIAYTAAVTSRVNLHGTIPSADFLRNTALQCWNNVATSRNHVATMLLRCSIGLKIVVATCPL